MNITEAFFVYFKVSAMTGLVITSPWVFFQIWMFIAAGLYPHEKRLVHVYLPFSLGLFITGALVCQFLVMPKAIEAMLWFNEWLGIDADLRLNEWLGFALMMPIGLSSAAMACLRSGSASASLPELIAFAASLKSCPALAGRGRSSLCRTPSRRSWSPPCCSPHSRRRLLAPRVCLCRPCSVWVRS